MELRLKMYEIMKKQGHEEETGKTKITSGYNLPATYILHTVGPIITVKLLGKEEELLASCYRECLKLAHGEKQNWKQEGGFFKKGNMVDGNVVKDYILINNKF